MSFCGCCAVRFSVCIRAFLSVSHTFQAAVLRGEKCSTADWPAAEKIVLPPAFFLPKSWLSLHSVSVLNELHVLWLGSSTLTFYAPVQKTQQQPTRSLLPQVTTACRHGQTARNLGNPLTKTKKTCGDQTREKYVTILRCKFISNLAIVPGSVSLI